MGAERIDANGAIKPEKADLSKNGRVNIDKLRKRDAKKVALRIDERTIILVHKKNATPEYAEAYRRKMNQIII
jgi:hypothetical protein